MPMAGGGEVTVSGGMVGHGEGPSLSKEQDEAHPLADANRLSGNRATPGDFH